jgi:hypothetical protein
MEKLSWQTTEYLHKQKTNDWYWIVGIITVSIAILAIILNDLIFGILIIVCSFTLALFASKKPAMIDVVIDDKGITVGSINYPYKNLESFWIETREVNPKIMIKSKKLFMHLIVVFIQNVEPETVHQALIKHLPEEELTEPLLEKILVYLGF